MKAASIFGQTYSAHLPPDSDAMWQMMCRLRFYMHRLMSDFGHWHFYLLSHLLVLRKFWHKRRSERIDAEKDRVRGIWEEMLNARKNSQPTMEDFSQVAHDEDRTAIEESKSGEDARKEPKNYIKLPKHYQPNLLSRVY